jgi:hypothetical protein
MEPFTPAWNLATIPFDAIPDALLRHWWSRRSLLRKGKKKNVSPEHRRYLDEKAAYMRQKRATARPGAPA